MKTIHVGLVERLCLALPFYLFTFLPLTAQNTFTQRIQQAKTGEGKVTVNHDAAIDVLVNGPKVAQQPVQEATHTQDSGSRTATEPTGMHTTTDNSLRTQQPATTGLTTDTATPDDVPVDTRKKVMLNTVKVPGYRVQAYAGGNSRQDRINAEKTANTIKRNYPDVPVYTHFYSPRWLCRVGNYRTYEEAHEMLQNVKKLGFKSATIVKGKISVQN